MRVYAYFVRTGQGRLQALSMAGVGLLSINTHTANLEEYFLSLIGQDK